MQNPLKSLLRVRGKPGSNVPDAPVFSSGSSGAGMLVSAQTASQFSAV